MVQLSDKTVLANFSVSRWGGHRFDKSATDQVHKANDAASDTGNYNKRLLPKGASSQIDACVNAARDYHRTHTLPWLDDGVRILPSSRYLEYADRMKDYRVEFQKEVQGFLKDYPTYIKTSKARLGKMFNLADYPTVQDLEKAYSWELTILPFPDAKDFRIAGVAAVSEDDIAKMRVDLEARMEQVWKNAMKDVGQRIADVVGRVSERLKAYKPGKPGKRAEGTFKDSLIDNVRELVAILPSLNLGNDKKLGKIITQMQDQLCKADADLLRDDDKARAKVAKSADAILTEVSDFIA